MSANPDKDESAQRQDEASALSVRYRGPLMAFFRRRTGSAVEAEDLAQEVLARLVDRDDIETLENPDAFIFRAARNLLLDRARRTEVRDRNYSDLEILTAGAEGLSPERVILGRESLQRALTALGELKPRTRDMFILHRLEGMKYRDIAELYGVSVSAVEKHLIKAIAHLANRMTDE